MFQCNELSFKSIYIIVWNHHHHYHHLENVNDMLCSRHISDAMITNDNERWTITTSFFHTKHQLYTHVLIIKFNSFFPTSATSYPIQVWYTYRRQIYHPSFSWHTSLPSSIYIFITLTFLSISQFVITTHQMPF